MPNSTIAPACVPLGCIHETGVFLIEQKASSLQRWSQRKATTRAGDEINASAGGSRCVHGRTEERCRKSNNIMLDRLLWWDRARDAFILRLWRTLIRDNRSMCVTMRARPPPDPSVVPVLWRFIYFSHVRSVTFYVRGVKTGNGRIFYGSLHNAVLAPMSHLMKLRPVFLFSSIKRCLYNNQKRQFSLPGLNLPRKLLDQPRFISLPFYSGFTHSLPLCTWIVNHSIKGRVMTDKSRHTFPEIASWPPHLSPTLTDRFAFAFDRCKATLLF